MRGIIEEPAHSCADALNSIPLSGACHPAHRRLSRCTRCFTLLEIDANYSETSAGKVARSGSVSGARPGGWHLIHLLGLDCFVTGQPVRDAVAKAGPCFQGVGLLEQVALRPRQEALGLEFLTTPRFTGPGGMAGSQVGIFATVGQRRQ